MTVSTETAPACDTLLDYLYDELDSVARAEFESHVASCASCRSEIGAMRRVRRVIQGAMPALDPPPRVAGPLHTQLLYAAARRTSRGGRLLRFARRVTAHPGYAAAAALVLVGGAVGVQWSRGRIFMQEPVPVHSEPATPAAAEGASTSKVALNAHAPLQNSEPEALPAAKKLTVKKSAVPVHRGYSKGDLRYELDDNMRGMKGGSGGKSERASTDDEKSAGGEGAPPASTPLTRSQGATATPNMPMGPPAPSPSPPPPDDEKPQKEAAQERLEMTRRAQVAAPSGPPPSPQLAEPQGNGRATMQELDSRGLLAKAERLASSDRCDEAVRLYADLERRYPKVMTPKDRQQYVRCLQAIGGLNGEAAAASTEINSSTQRGGPRDRQRRTIVEKRTAPAKKAKNADPQPDEMAPILRNQSAR